MSDPREPFETIRPLLVEATTVPEGSLPHVRVALEHGGELFVREAVLREDAEDPAARASAAAEATAAALGLITPSVVELRVEWSALVPTHEGLPPIIAAMIGVSVAGVPMRYAGAVVADGDPATAGARSTLDALNRRLGVTGL